MIQRSRRSVPAGVVAVVVLAICVLVAVSCVQVLTGRPPWLPFSALAQLAAHSTATSPQVIAAAIVAGLLGLALLVAAFTPGPAAVLPLDPGSSGLPSGFARQSLTRALRATASDVEGVDKARVRLGTRRVKATITTPLHDPGSLREQVTAALDRRLTDIGPARRPHIRVRVKTRSES